MSRPNVRMIRQQKIEYGVEMVEVRQLAFYPDNPRVYSQFADESERTQEQIEERMVDLDHVRELRNAIDRDGQVNEALWVVPVQDVDPSLGPGLQYVVLEGNRRLGALRIEKPTTLPPTEVRCNILDFEPYTREQRDSLIFSLLGQIHIETKKDWEPFERAAFIRRRHEIHKIPLDELVAEIGIKKRMLQTLVNAHRMMEQHSDSDRSNWSFYQACVASNKLRKQRENIPGLDETVVRCIKRGDFGRAQDMRDRLPAILENKSARKVFLREEGESAFRDALEIAEASGSTNDTYRQLRRFRLKLAASETKEAVRRLLADERKRRRTVFELKRIQKLVDFELKRMRRVS